MTDEELKKLLAESPNLVAGAAATSSSKNKKKKKKAAGAAVETADKENQSEKEATPAEKKE